MAKIGRQLELGVDFGTVNTLVYVKGEGIKFNEPSVIAINQKTQKIIAVGEEAKRMLGRTPAHILAIKPLSQGIVTDFEASQFYMKIILEKLKTGRFFLKPPLIIVGVPLDLTEVQKKAVSDAILQAGASSVYLVEEPIAGALGGNLVIEEAKGIFIVDLGGGTTDIAVISLGGVVVGRSIKIAGEKFNQDIINYVKENLRIIIGESQAEEAKIKIGNLMPKNHQEEFLVRGRDFQTGLPKEVILKSVDIKMALEESVKLIIENIKDVIEITPPDLLGDILKEGIYLTGGSSLLKGLPELMEKELKLKVNQLENPLFSVIRGIGMILENRKALSHFLEQI